MFIVSMSLRIFYLSLGILGVAGICPEIPIGQVPYVEARDDLAVLVVLDGDVLVALGLDHSVLTHGLVMKQP